MTDLLTLAPSARLALAGLLFLAVLGETALCLYRYSCTGNAKFALKNGVLFLPLLAILSFVTATAVDERSADPLPWLLLLPLCALVFAHTFFGIRKEYRKSKRMPSPSSVKQALDNLNTGICFADKSGRVILINHEMRRLVHALSGRYPQTKEEIDGALSSYAEPLEEGSGLFRFPDGKIGHFRTAPLEAPDLDGFTQTAAQDVTDLFYATLDLRRTNEKLRQTNAKLKETYDRLADRIREQETLELKMRIHDNIGTSLIAISEILSGETLDADEQLSILQNAVRCFSSDRPAPPETWEDVKRSAKDLHVTVTLDGALPEDGEAKRLLFAAVHECVTNCIYHAGGDRVNVRIETAEAGMTAAFTNNGDAPKGPVREGGGLSSLRRRVEAAHGAMRLLYEPRFTLMIELPKEEENA